MLAIYYNSIGTFSHLVVIITAVSYVQVPPSCARPLVFFSTLLHFDYNWIFPLSTSDYESFNFFLYS